MLELEHVSAVVAVVCEAVSQPCSPVTYSVSPQPSSGSPGLLLVLTVVACSSNGHQVHVCALLGSLPAVSRLLMPHLLPIRHRTLRSESESDSVRLNEIVQANQTNGRVETDVFILLWLWRFVWTPSALSGLAMTIAVPHTHTVSCHICTLTLSHKGLHRNAVNLFLPNRMKEMPV